MNMKKVKKWLFSKMVLVLIIIFSLPLLFVAVWYSMWMLLQCVKERRFYLTEHYKKSISDIFSSIGMLIMLLFNSPSKI